jgi:hypothetical protein
MHVRRLHERPFRSFRLQLLPARPFAAVRRHRSGQPCQARATAVRSGPSSPRRRRGAGIPRGASDLGPAAARRFTGGRICRVSSTPSLHRPTATASQNALRLRRTPGAQGNQGMPAHRSHADQGDAINTADEGAHPVGPLKCRHPEFSRAGSEGGNVKVLEAERPMSGSHRNPTRRDVGGGW